MKKYVRLGRLPNVGNVFATIEITNGRLSITGVEGPLANGNARGSCGQINDSIAADIDRLEFAPGWTRDSVARFLEIWERWHLNDMRAGSPAQTAWLCAKPVSFSYPRRHYDKACGAVCHAGL